MKITEKSLLPAGFIEDRMIYCTNSWGEQYMSFDQETRDAAAVRLYEALSEKQRIELRRTGWVTFKCKAGHEVRVTPEFSGTTNVGCYSIGNGKIKNERGGYEGSAHASTTIGDFLLTLKIQFALACVCRQSHNQVVMGQAAILGLK